MHVALLSSQRAYYGGEVHLRDLARALRRLGHEVSCLVRPDSALAERFAQDGQPATTLPLDHWYQPLAVAGLRRRIRRLDPDILHTHSPHDYYLAATATVGMPVRNVGTRHQLRPIAMPGLKRPFLARFQAMIAVSEAVRDGLIASGLPARRLVTVLNGVRRPEQLESPSALRRQLNLDDDGGPVVGFVGRLCPTKGLPDLFWALSLLRGRWPGLRLVLLGEGACEAQLRELADHLSLDVRFCGYREEAARYMPAFDLLAVPSQAEPFGLVTLEAMARGVPVVATWSGGSREIVRDGVDGLLVPPGDPEALAAALHRLLEDHEARAACGAAGPRRVAECFTLEHQVAATETVYRLVMDGAPLPDRIALGEARRGRAAG